MSLVYFLLNSLLLGGCIWLLWRQTPDILRRWFIPALALKLLCGIMVGILYQYYYNGEDTFDFHKRAFNTYGYFQINPLGYLRLLFTNTYDGPIPWETLFYYPAYSNSYFVILVLSLLNILTGGSYYLNGLYFSLFSFYGCWQLTKVLTIMKPEGKLAALFAFFLLPSVVFWSSGITKEAIYVGALCWFMALILELAHRPTTKYVFKFISLFVAAWLLWKIKYYYAAAVFPLFGSYLFVSWFQQQNYVQLTSNRKYMLFGLIVILLSVFVSQMHGIFRLEYFLYHLMDNYTALAKLSVGKPNIHYPDLQPAVTSILWHTPQAIWQATFRPYLGEGDNVLYLFAGIENLVLLIIVGLAGWRFFRNKGQKPELFLVILMVYCLILAALIGLTTPNLGSLNRYRVAYLPFLVYVLLQSLPVTNRSALFTNKSGTDKSGTGLQP